MVRIDDISVELVDAGTKQPFKEHPARNRFDGYVEVEPGVEYFIKVHNYSNHKVLTYFTVDGKDLGYNLSLHPQGNGEAGLWKYENNMNKMTALKVDKMVFVPTNGKSNSSDDIGTIKVRVYEEIILEGHFYINDYTSNWESEVANSHGEGPGKKVVKSSIGHTTTSKLDDGRRQNYRRGQLLRTIRLKYCSTVGLIAAGVLPKPPKWEWLKMVKPSVINHTKLELKPIMIDHSMRNPDGSLLEEKKIELYDLTNMSDDDDY